MDAGDPTALVDGVLWVHGTDGNDAIVIEDTGWGQTAVTVNDTTQSITDPVTSVRAFGYEGDDTIEMKGALSITAAGGGGEDTLVGGSADDVLDGGGGDDTIYGNSGNDTVYGRGGADELHGGWGNDTLCGEDAPQRAVWSLGAAGWEMIAPDLDALSTVPSRQGAGEQRNEDLLVVSVYDRVVAVSAAQVTRASQDAITQLRTQAAEDPQIGRAVTETALPVTVTGWLYSADDVIWGDAGNDFLYGGIGADELHGGMGEDHIYGEGGNDDLYGDENDDVLRGGSGNDNIEAGLGHDLAKGDDGNDVLAGGVGNDTLEGGGGNDILLGQDGCDVILGGDGDDVLMGGAQADILCGDDGQDQLFGEAGDDDLYGGRDNDVLYGGDGADMIRGRQGNDVIYGGTGNDDLDGGSGDDTIYGNDGQDELYGDHGNDQLFGQNGEDTIEGGWGNDTISGGYDADHLEGGFDDDQISGDDADDVIEGGPGQDTLWGGAGADELYGDSGNDTLWGGVGDDELYGGVGHDQLHGGDGRDLLYGEAGSDVLWGDAGPDRLVGGYGDDDLHGGSGMDGLFAHQGTDTYDGGPASDRIYVGFTPLILVLPGEDAGFHIVNGAGGEVDGSVWQPGVWTQAELDYLDDVLRAMHEHKGNDTTIQRANGGYVTWIRAGAYDGAWGWNSDGVITLTNNAFVSRGRYGRTIVHELGHNWDTESSLWQPFLAVSGWTEITGPFLPPEALAKIAAGWQITEKYGETWLYNPAVTFYRDYGHSHPKEDWSTCWEAYFFGATPVDDAGILDVDSAWMQTHMPGKSALLHVFLS